MSGLADRIVVAEEVAEALAEGRPVVALETAVVTTGLPRDPLEASWVGELDGWRKQSAANLEAGRALERVVRRGGAVPATVALVAGALRVGLEPAELEALAADPDAGKASVTDLASLMARGVTAGTTVSATLAACATARPRPIRVFATGGIGGVHRGWTTRPDVSADLARIGRTPCCVVCAGAKSILDAPATLEMLEALGVPVVGWETDVWPQFVVRPDQSLRLRHRCDEAGAVAETCVLHWGVVGAGGVVLAVPPDPDRTLGAEELDAATAEAETRAAEAGIRGAAVTPFLLGELARLTEGRTLRANLALLSRNAAVAAAVAGALHASS